MEFKYAIMGLDYTFEEQGNQFGAIRKIKWGDSDKVYTEIRKWRNANGVETASKGYTFITEEGPSELAKGLLDLGYGNNKQVLDILKNRDDFRKSLNTVLGKDDELFDESVGTLEDDYYDPKDLLGE